jgi:hypothetical protein
MTISFRDTDLLFFFIFDTFHPDILYIRLKFNGSYYLNFEILARNKESFLLRFLNI